MIWVAWRTQRLQLLVTVGLALLLAFWVATTGLTVSQSNIWKYWTDGAVFALYALPAIVGIGVGASLVAGELDHRTQRLAWTQGMSRRQWLIWKIAVGAGVIVIASGLLVVLIQWWTSAANIALTSSARGPTRPVIVPSVFDVTGIVIIGYALFAFALGVALGTVVRRPGWTFAAAVPIFIGARLLVRFDVRPHILAPATYSSPTGNYSPRLTTGWLLNSGILPVGRTSPLPGHGWSTLPRRFTACMSAEKSQYAQTHVTPWAHCVVVNHLHYVVKYQPASHYWPLQGAETAIFVAAAVLLLGLAVLGVNRITA